MRLSREQAKAMGIDLGNMAKKRRKSPPVASKEQTEADIGRSLFIAQAVAYGLPEPIPEYQFHDTRNWAFDWLFLDFVALEIEGGIFAGKPCKLCGQRMGGRHNSGTGMVGDMAKYREAAILGYVVIRVTPEEVASGAAFALVQRAIEECQ